MEFKKVGKNKQYSADIRTNQESKKTWKVKVFKCFTASASKNSKNKMDSMFVQFKTKLLKLLLVTENSSEYEVPRTAKRVKAKK